LEQAETRAAELIDDLGGVSHPKRRMTFFAAEANGRKIDSSN